ncbi:MAG: FecR domain-containing protein [Cytophagales bacterium]|nr:FecR domain-containing protein [Cytophagales bacterium]
MDRNQTKEIVQKLLAGSITENEFQALKDLMNNPSTAAATREILEQAGIEAQSDNLGLVFKDDEGKEISPKVLMKEKILKRLGIKDTKPEKQKPGGKQRPFWSRWLKAAVLLLATSSLAWIMWYNYRTDTPIALLEKETQRGHKATLTLADGSTVILNSQSKLIYPENFDNIREVTLEGEAFFQVNRNPAKPFIVHSHGLKTTVLGTSFNIKAFNDEDIAVTVATGKVKVQAANNAVNGTDVSPIALAKGEQAIFNTSDNTLKKHSINATDFIVWKEGILKFQKANLSKVVEALARWYNVDFTLENDRLDRCTVIGTYKNQSLVTVLENLKFVLDIEYEFTPQGVLISGEGCD